MNAEVQKMDVMRNGKPRQTVARINPQPKKGNAKMEAKKNGKQESKAETKKGSIYDHRAGSQAELIDNLVIKGTSLPDALEALKKFVGKGFKGDAWARVRFLGHFKHLKEDHKLTVSDKEGFYKIEMKGEKK